MLGYLLLTLLPVAAVLYIVWAHRRRAVQRAAESSKRFAEVFGAVAPVRPSQSPATAGPIAAAPLCLKRDKVLDGQHAMLFRALSAALQGHLVFPHVSLSAIVQLPPALQGREREQRLRALAQNTVDCLVCDAETHAVAAIDLENGASPEWRIKSEYLAAAQLRYVRVDPAVLPAPQEIRNLVLSSSEVKSR